MFFAKHGKENLRTQIMGRGSLNSLMPREFVRMTGKCIRQMDCARILKRAFCIYKALRTLPTLDLVKALRNIE